MLEKYKYAHLACILQLFCCRYKNQEVLKSKFYFLVDIFFLI